MKTKNTIVKVDCVVVYNVKMNDDILWDKIDIDKGTSLGSREVREMTFSAARGVCTTRGAGMYLCTLIF